MPVSPVVPTPAVCGVIFIENSLVFIHIITYKR